MKVLVVGANGYIGSRLIPVLLQEGHQVVALVRNKRRIKLPEGMLQKITLIEGDLLQLETLHFPKDCDAAYYLAHSMSYSKRDFQELEARSAHHFCQALKATQATQIIYLSALTTGERLSKHFTSRLNVEAILQKSLISVTIFRAGIIIGSGSASFEIIYDLVERLPLMVTPKWVKNRCQPIAIYDVLYYLQAALGKKECLGQMFEMAGPDQLNYRQMMQHVAKALGLKRAMITVPVLTPRLSSYWLYFVTSTNYRLASTLVDSLKSEAISHDRKIDVILPHRCLSFEEAIQRALARDEHEKISTSWKFAQCTEEGPKKLPETKFLEDRYEKRIATNRHVVRDKIWRLGGKHGWYAYDFAWAFRGFIDKLFGGVGLRRGRSDPHDLSVGDALDFWRVVDANRKEGYLLLYAEMRLPGEAWLEFTVTDTTVIERIIFQPKGVFGYLYWYCLYPIHHLIFKTLVQRIAT